jgi:hypothetical protein
MANKIPVKARYTGSDVTSLGEFETGDKIANAYLDEAVTTLSLASNTLTYTNEDGVVTNISLSPYIDDTNLARLTSGTLNTSTGVATFTRDDTTTFTVDLSNLQDPHPTGDGNLHVPATSTTNNGKYLQAGSTAGSLSWTDVDALPSQTLQNGKYLTTNGSAASWAALDTDANTTTKGLYEHAHTINTAYSITSTNNAMSAGPVVIGSSGSVTVPATSVWTIV